MAPKINKFDPTVIPYLAAFTTAIMLMRAAVEHFGIWGWAIGPMAGAVVSFALATAGSKIGEISKKRKPVAYVSLVGMVVLSPVVIGLSDPTPDAATWAWALFPDVSILLASAVTGKSLLAKPETQGTQGGGQGSSKKSRKGKQGKRKIVQEADLLAYIAQHKKDSHDDIAQHFGVSRQAIDQRVAKLKKQGKLK